MPKSKLHGWMLCKSGHPTGKALIGQILFLVIQKIGSILIGLVKEKYLNNHKIP